MSDTVYVTLDREEFTAAAPTGAAIAAYGDAVVTGEPVPLAITVEDAAGPGDGDDDGDGNGGSDTGDDGSSNDNETLPDTGGPALATPLNLGMALMSILMGGGVLIAANRKRKRKPKPKPKPKPGSNHGLA